MTPRIPVVRLACRQFAVGLMAIWLSTTAVLAQTSVQASIIGIVTDETGAVLPGVTITASSPALQLKRVTGVTDTHGEYRLSGLDIGLYEVTYSLDGFQGVKREGVRLSAGFTAKIDVALKLGSINETITVSGASPVVDVASTSGVTTLTQETLELIPTSRQGVISMLNQAPGVRSNLDVGGNSTGTIPSFRAFGQDSAWPVIEGLAANYYPGGANASGVYIDYGGVDEVQISPSGNDAESPMRGVTLRVIVKSGGNTFHGEALGSWTHPRLFANNATGILAEQGILGVPVLRRWDFGGDFGGYVVKDKLWFYTGGRDRKNDVGVLDCYRPDGTQCEGLQQQWFGDGKATYQINSAHRLLGYYQWNRKDGITGASQLREWASRNNPIVDGNGAKIEWQGTFRSNVVANALVGYWGFDSLHLNVEDCCRSRFYGENTGRPRTQDLVTLKVTGPGGVTDYAYNRKDQFSGSLGWFKSDGFLGDHNVKVGGDFMKGLFRTPTPGRPGGDYILLLNGGVPFQIQVYNTPLTRRNNGWNLGVFVKDQWRMARLTLNLGGRLAFDHVYVPAQCTDAGVFVRAFPADCISRVDLPAWNTVVPRVHAAYDLMGSGRTVLKGGWGRFTPIRAINDGAYLNPLDIKSMTFRWRDLNGNRDFDFGETNLDPNGPDYVSGGIATPGIVNPDEEPSYVDEFTLAIERQMWRDFGVRVGGIVSRETNLSQVINPLIPYSAYTIPVTNLDPGPDGVLNTADDTGKPFTYWEYPASLRGTAFQQVTRVNDRGLDRLYRSLEFAVSKRLSNKWQAMASYARTWLHVPPLTANPNQAIAAGGVNETVEWELKAAGSYQAPFGILASLNYQLRSGNAWQRTVLFRGGRTIPTFVAAVEPLQSHYYEDIHLLDARARKEVRLYGSHKAALGIDVYNLLNINTVTSITTRSGPAFGRVTTTSGKTTDLPFITGRNLQLTLNYAF